MKIYIFTITYNFDGSYIARKCNTYEEAVIMLNDYLKEKIKVIQTECDYIPSVLEWNEADVTLVYAEEYTKEDNYEQENCSFYRIFEVEI